MAGGFDTLPGRSVLLALCLLAPSLAQAQQTPQDAYHAAWLDYLVAQECEATAGEMSEVYEATLKQLRIRRLAPLNDALAAFQAHGMNTGTFGVEIMRANFGRIAPDDKVRLSNWKVC